MLALIVPYLMISVDFLFIHLLLIVAKTVCSQLACMLCVMPGDCIYFSFQGAMFLITVNDESIILDLKAMEVHEAHAQEFLKRILVLSSVPHFRTTPPFWIT